MAKVGSAEDIPEDGTNARVGMFSARFDRSPTETLFRGVYQILKEKNYPVLMVDAAAGKSFGKLTAAYLGKLKREKGVLLAVCTWHYAEVTDSKFSSYEELRVAHENGLDILPLRVCDDPWPPEPPCGPENKYDEMGEGAGLLDLAIGQATVYVDCRGKDENYIAKKIAETLLPGGRRPSGHGKVGSGASRTAGYSQQDTKSAVPSASPSPAAAAEAQEWCDLGSRGGGKRNGQRYSKQDCYVKALELDENYARAWSNLGLEGGGSVKGQAYDEKGCCVKALELDENDAGAWFNLGCVGGSTVKGQDYDAKGCYIKALELDENDAFAWNNLGNRGGGTVKGQDYDAKACHVKSLELNEKNAATWYNLGLKGGSTVKGQAYDKKDCFVRALELNENDARFWRQLGKAGGGTVRGTHYVPDECKAKAAGK